MLLRGVKCRQSGLQGEKLDKMCPPRVTNPKQPSVRLTDIQPKVKHRYDTEQTPTERDRDYIYKMAGKHR